MRSHLVSKIATLLYQDINLGTTEQGGDNGGDFTPIAGSFIGTFDGRGRKIMNLTISVSGDAGLFLELGTSGVIQNLGIENFDVATTNASGGKAGSLVAESDGSVVDCYAVDSDDAVDVSGSAAANDSVGGLVGEQNGGSITTSHATGAVDGGGENDSVGGLLGQQDGGSIVSSYATGAANGGDGQDGVGGLVGLLNTGSSIIASYATGAANGGDGQDGVGGLVGQQFVDSIIISSYATGAANGGGNDNDTAGGLDRVAVWRLDRLQLRCGRCQQGCG